MGGIGNFQLQVNSMSIAMGGGVRVGLEDNIWFDSERTKLARNIDLLNRIHRLIQDQGLKLMSSGSLRQILNLQSGNGVYGRSRMTS
jgi:uncharacterized protein (DUF849 family)